MVEHTQFGPQDPDFDGYSRGRSRQRRYAFGRSAKTDYDEPVPLFLSDPDGEPDPSEYDYPDFEVPRTRMSISLKILMAVVAAAGVAMLFAMATSDAARDIIVSAKASFISATPTPAEAAQPDVPPQANTSRLAASDAQTKDADRWAAPGTIVPTAAASNAPQTTGITRGPVVAMAPTRDDTSSAYQNPAQSRAPAVPAPPAASAAPAVTPAPVATAPAVAAPPPPRVIDADELAILMKRAKEMLSAGDIPAARLLLRRAADGRDPTAALLLAQTYDPEMLGTQDARNIIPDPETARAWYQKAAQLGSTDAQRRLAQMQ